MGLFFFCFFFFFFFFFFLFSFFFSSSSCSYSFFFPFGPVPVTFSTSACPRMNAVKNSAGPSTTPPGAKYHPNHASDSARSATREGPADASAGAQTAVDIAVDIKAEAARVDDFGTCAPARATGTTRRAGTRRVPPRPTRPTRRGASDVDAEADMSPGTTRGDARGVLAASVGPRNEARRCFRFTL